MIPSYELSPKRSAQDNCLDNYRKRFHRVSRRHHGSKSMMSDTRRKSCITEFEEDLGKAAKNPFQELFAKFCSSSTIHGTYFWIASGSYLVRAAWGLIGTFQVTVIKFWIETWETFLMILKVAKLEFRIFFVKKIRQIEGASALIS